MAAKTVKAKIVRRVIVLLLELPGLLVDLVEEEEGDGSDGREDQEKVGTLVVVIMLMKYRVPVQLLSQLVNSYVQVAITAARAHGILFVMD